MVCRLFVKKYLVTFWQASSVKSKVSSSKSNSGNLNEWLQYIFLYVTYNDSPYGVSSFFYFRRRFWLKPNSEGPESVKNNTLLVRCDIDWEISQGNGIISKGGKKTFLSAIIPNPRICRIGKMEIISPESSFFITRDLSKGLEMWKRRFRKAVVTRNDCLFDE